MAEYTERLRLEPVGPANADDLWLVHGDDEAWPSYGNEKPDRLQVERWAASMGESWRSHGAAKWIAYNRVSGEVVGRGGLGRTPVDDDWGRVYDFLPAEPWVDVVHENRHPSVVHANWLEIGWALRHEFWGRGYAAEVGRAGLAYAFDVLGMEAVMSCTDHHNVRSRAVMERIGMRYAGDLWSEEFEGALGNPPLTVCVLLRKNYQRSPTTPAD
ncbi:Acetyltransferase (GNAT) domain-containing protein [Actinopolymorpha cephalotaxi]|uniref:Acetyltransferase (GNAT) domain-containing protein n=1 Tax=Actinopolymorpha cephalotaxi TaxID=504797 RepID=A0A1I2N2H0_9ACTN|nr:GNAT family N-acetyltransferase [Actinopolymorpha cephalotaxi]NYH85712.1 RimJ/RimL family protein N-acetyltransferase [Actinopolymorpha cephalotaxi]SFF98054.1 Acetyltransferase (GNAT) domain-containing protein [Actinopolymorpha cephalotaxi]